MVLEIFLPILEFYNDALANPLVWLLFVLVIADLGMGNIMAWTSKSYTSKKGIAGFIKHFGILSSVTLVLPMVTAVTGTNLISVGITTYLCYLYVVSILETLGKLGVPIPKEIKDRLTQVTESKLNIKLENKSATSTTEHEYEAEITTEVDTNGEPIDTKEEET